MLRTYLLVILLVSLLFIYKVEANSEITPTDNQIKTCTYTAGVAREVQVIRSTHKKSWEEFTSEVGKVYKKDEGLSNIIAIAYIVYSKFDIKMEESEVFTSTYESCISYYTAGIKV